MSEELRGRFRAATVVFGPLFLLVALFYHPYIADLTDESQVAAAMSANIGDTVRWGLSHVAVGAGFGLLLLAFLGASSFLREAGEQRWSAIAVPFLVMGTIFSTFLPAMETAMIAAYETGADPVALQANLSTWFIPMLVAGAVLFGAGVLLFAAGVVRSGVFEVQQARIIAGVLAVAAITRLIPQGRALYAGGVAALVALAPIGLRMWRAVPGYASTRSTGVTGRPGTAR